ncbi:DUF6491 family protein [Shewanella sp. 1_MG-2023]|uniref:DUF6491 family protein n=1 Tax=unclassified Shewanella TaxID=196818 RepID=UPI0026E21AAD|nr:MULTISPECIES: DUF6491 family protein [unclassified Shewanella]MDO6613039.1 DUF6491 family protein [Shewanella sp. 7_MG-2023]MDO6772907.1 DUF6491 family protein [Shewanella sp. 2_MG-2023]MDO6796639.1 DUF6491 family protein [Shewanella sp. 1_MG-2023]
MIKRLILICSMLLLTACTASESAQKKAALYQFDELVEVNSIDNFRMDGWRTMDNRTVFVDSRPRETYLLVLNGVDSNLKFAQALVVSSRMGKVTVGFDSVMTGSEPRSRTQIKKIYRIESKEQEQQVRAKIESFSEKD